YEEDLRTYCLVSEQLNENLRMSVRQAIKKIFTKLLDSVREENPTYADILHDRFWVGQSALSIIYNRDLFWSERSFYNHQSRAIKLLAFLFWEQEQLCMQSPLAEAE